MAALVVKKYLNKCIDVLFFSILVDWFTNYTILFSDCCTQVYIFTADSNLAYAPSGAK